MITEILNNPITYYHHLIALVVLTPIIILALFVSWRIQDKRRNRK